MPSANDLDPNDPYAAFRVRPSAVPASGVAEPLRAPVSHDAAPWAADPYAAFRQKPSVAADVAKSAGSGLVRGTTEMLMTPSTLPKLAADALVSGGEWAVRSALGLGPVTPETQALRDRAKADTVSSLDPQNVVAAVRGAEDAHLHTPQTTAGRYAETIGEFVPTVIAGPGGLLRKAAEAIVPGAMSEAAGEATKGTPAEPYARMLGGLGGNIATTAPQLYRGSVDRIIARAVTGTDPAAYQTAQALQTRAAAMGVPLSGPEAIQAATNGATKLGDVQRVVEGSTDGGARTSRFYAQRPDQVAAAAGNAFDRIAPALDSATGAGLAGQTAAQNAMLASERYRTAATTPLYDAAAGVRVDPGDMGQLMSDMAAAMAADRTGVTANEIGRLRDMLVDQPGQPGIPGTPAARAPVTGPNGQTIRYDLTPATPGTPAQPMSPVLDIENANRARRQMRDRLSMPVAPGREPITAEQQHAVGPFMDRLNEMMSAASPDYAAANRLHGQISDDIVKPIAAGPVGRIAKTTDVGEQGRAILPPTPSEGAPNDAAIAVALLAQHDPAAAAAIVRNRLGQQFAESSQDNMSGPNQFGGAKFAAQIAGNPIQADALRAALGALPNAGGAGNPVQHVDDLLNVFQATGWRKPQGSATEFNRQMAAELGHQSVPAAALQAVATGGLGLPSMLGKIAEGARMHALNRNSGRLADLFLAPDSAAQIGMLAARGAQHPLVDMLRRQGRQIGAELQP